jgi:colanic acid biosynthesis glycosyl transferase WcaI
VPIIARGRTRIRLALNFASFAISGVLFGGLALRRNKFDKIFVFAPSPITVLVPAIFARSLFHAPLTCWVLDLWPETLQAVGAVRGRIALSILGAFVALLYRGCDRILVQSRMFVAPVARRCRPETRVDFFPNWAESLFSNVRSDPAPELAELPNGTTVLFAGNIGEAQDFPAVLSAAEHLRHVRSIRWVIVGDGRMAEWVRREIEVRNLSRTVLMLGRFPLERMPSFYRHADALLVSLKADPAFEMTIPGKLQSYLAAGVPVIGMLDGEGARLIEESGAGLVCAAGDWRGLAKCVSQLSSMSNEERTRLGRCGVELTQRLFDRQSLVTELERTLSETTFESSKV